MREFFVLFLFINVLILKHYCDEVVNYFGINIYV